MANLLPPLGLILGSLVGARLSKSYSLELIIYAGILIASLGTVLMFMAMHFHLHALIALFLPMIVIFFGLCFILANRLYGFMLSKHGNIQIGY